MYVQIYVNRNKNDLYFLIDIHEIEFEFEYYCHDQSTKLITLS